MNTTHTTLGQIAPLISDEYVYVYSASSYSVGMGFVPVSELLTRTELLNRHVVSISTTEFERGWYGDVRRERFSGIKIEIE